MPSSMEPIMSGAIYLIRNDRDLVEMTEQPYDSEDMLQELLAKYPNLLAGDQMDAVAPRRWLLISRRQKTARAETLMFLSCLSISMFIVLDVPFFGQYKPLIGIHDNKKPWVCSLLV